MFRIIADTEKKNLNSGRPIPLRLSSYINLNVPLHSVSPRVKTSLELSCLCLDYATHSVSSCPLNHTKIDSSQHLQGASPQCQPEPLLGTFLDSGNNHTLQITITSNHSQARCPTRSPRPAIPHLHHVRGKPFGSSITFFSSPLPSLDQSSEGPRQGSILPLFKIALDFSHGHADCRPIRSCSVAD